MAGFFNTFVYQPLYNGLIFLMGALPWADVGLVVIIFTLIIKFLLYPLSQKALVTQRRIKEFEPELKKIKEQYKKDPPEQARRTLNLYKEKGINPFSSFFLILIQLPIIFALYRIFWASHLPEINREILYSFVSAPTAVNMIFLGFLDMASRSWLLAILVGISTFIQMRLTMPKLQFDKNQSSFKNDLARSMNIQMRYFFPAIAVFISYSLSGAVALYWLTSNVFAIGQDFWLKRNRPNQHV